MDRVAVLLEAARQAGLVVIASGDRLIIRGPKSAESVARKLIERKREILPALSSPPAALRVYLRHLDTEVWLVPDDDDAARLAVDLRTERDPRPVVTAVELCRLADLIAADAQNATRAAALVMRNLPGSRLRHTAGFDA